MCKANHNTDHYDCALILNASKIITIKHNNFVRYVNSTCTFDINTLTMFIIGFVTRLPRRVSPVEQELLTLPEYLSSSRVVRGFRVTRSLVVYVCFVDRCLSILFWSLYCLVFFDIQIMITPLISSSSS